MPDQWLIELTVLILAAFLGFEVIAKVPTLLHTPLMSGTNAIHGIVLVGAMIVAGLPDQPTWVRVVSLAAVALGTLNVVGGFVVTDRMLEMFKKRPEPGRPSDEVPLGASVEPEPEAPVRASGPGEGVRGNREVPPTTTVRE
jgi:proton-translocating NAD(P)+ transhydrogenase subunit alpha